jgi:hypothetical protein
MSPLTWAPIGEDGVAVVAEASDKDAVTVLASVTAAHRKFPLDIIAKWLMERSERGELGLHEGHKADQFPSGWTTGQIFARYLHWLRSQCPDQKRIHMILDMYSVHLSEGSKTVARQRLDHYIFGALKSMCKRFFYRHHELYDDGRTWKPDAIRFLIEAWEFLNADVVRKAWGPMKMFLMVLMMTIVMMPTEIQPSESQS